MGKKFDLVALGESLIDFTPAGVDARGIQLFGQNPGGAPANVLAMMAKLGGQTAFIGKVGQDAFGDFLAQNMQQAGIDIDNLCRDPEIPTTLAFVQLDAVTGERSFTFYRKPGADERLCVAEVSGELLAQAAVFHYGSVSLTKEPCRTATLTAAKQARAQGALISYDPNYRPFLWDDQARACAEMNAAFALADIVKVSEEELLFLTGQDDLAKGAAEIAAAGPCVVVVTLGEKGSFLYTKQHAVRAQGMRVDSVDTTGAGDSFWGALLWKIGRKTVQELAQISGETWAEYLRFANTVGALTTTAKGAIPAMPSAAEISAFMDMC